MAQNSVSAMDSCKQTFNVNAVESQSTNMILRVDRDGAITEANTWAIKALGYSREQIIGAHYGRFLLLSHSSSEPASDVRLDDPIASCLATGQVFLSAYGMLRRADRRSLQPIEVCIAPVYQGGAITEVILMIDDDDLRRTDRNEVLDGRRPVVLTATQAAHQIIL